MKEIGWYWFSWPYFQWMVYVYKNFGENALIRGDKEVSGRFGLKLGNSFKEEFKDFVGDELSLLLNALKMTPWFLEDMTIAKQTGDTMILEANNCSFQRSWAKIFGKPYPHCIEAHQGFLEGFTKGLGLRIRVSPLSRPTFENNYSCSFIFRLPTTSKKSG